MNEKYFAQILAELTTANEQALALLVMAIAKQLNAERLKLDLEAIIKNMQGQPGWSATAARTASRVLPAIHAEALHQATPAGEGRRPI